MNQIIRKTLDPHDKHKNSKSVAFFDDNETLENSLENIDLTEKKIIAKENQIRKRNMTPLNNGHKSDR